MRKLTLKPSRPEVQNAKNAYIQHTKRKRSSRKLDQATTLAERKTTASGLDPAERRELEATFLKWWSDYYSDAADLLPEHELMRLHQAAKAFVMKELPIEVWRELREAFEKFRAAVQPVIEVRRWKGIKAEYSRPLGW